MHTSPVRASFALAISTLLGLWAPAAATEGEFQLRRAGSVYLDEIVPAPDGERVVDLYVRVETIIGEPIELDRASLAIRDNGELVDDVEIARLAEAGVGSSAVLVLDTSRSMAGEPFDQAKAAAVAFLDRMGEFDHVAIVSFDDDVTVEARFGEPRTQTKLVLEDLQTARRGLSKLVWDGVQRGVELLRDRPPGLPPRAFIIVFSDGRDSGSTHEVDEVMLAADGDAGESRIPIFTTAFSAFGRRGFDELAELASRTGGTPFEASSPAQLEEFFDEIRRRMTQSYRLRFEGELDGAEHSVQVTVDGQSDSRTATYPAIQAPIWPWLAGGAVVLVVGAGAAAFFLRRDGGRLVFDSGPRSGEAWTIRGSKVKVGALDENDLVLDAPTVSRFHAQIYVGRGRLEVDDLGSRNGTFVNGTPVRARSEVLPGDVVRFGEVEMIYRR